MKIKFPSLVSGEFSAEQNQLLSILMQGKNCYFTGKAGTGKTAVLKEFIARSRRNKVKLGITAPTGVSAAAIDGQTLHSFTGIPPRASNLQIYDYISNINKTPSVKKRYLKTDTLIIDEISMLEPTYFDVFNSVCKKVRGNNDPFGGIQMVLSGDFHQLPPVNDHSMSSALERTPILQNSRFLTLLNKSATSHSDPPYDSIRSNMGHFDLIADQRRFLFDSMAWKELMINGMQTKLIEKSFRQSDPLFLSILDDIRDGVYSDELFAYLAQHKRKEFEDGEIKPTYLSAYRSAAHLYNRNELYKLKGDMKTFQAVEIASLVDSFGWSTVNTDSLDPALKGLQCESLLNLKVGAQVILLKNLNVKEGLANGSRGVVVAFERQLDMLTNQVMQLPLVRFTNGSTYVIGYHDFSTVLDTDGLIATRKQIPLKLGWGITIHKAQGMTLDRAVIQLDKAFAPGHAYVALSRVKSLNGLSLQQFNRNSLWVSERVKKFYSKLFP